MIFLTTNHLDRLDPALQRPGRVGCLVEMPLADAAQATEMWHKVFPKQLSPAKLSEVLFNHRHDTPDMAASAFGRPRQ